MKKVLCVLLAVISALLLSSCGGDGALDDGIGTDSIAETTAENLGDEDGVNTTDDASEESKMVLTAEDLMQFSVVYPEGADETVISIARDIKYAIGRKYGVSVYLCDDSGKEGDYEILVGITSRGSARKTYARIYENKYIVSLINKPDGCYSFAVATKGDNETLAIAADKFIELFVRKETEIDPNGFSLVGESLSIRDPQILFHNGTYYIYGTTITDGFWAYTSKDLLTFEGPKLLVAEKDMVKADRNYWAAECHEINGSFYLFGSYKSDELGHSGTAVFVADDPLGPFLQISDPFITKSGVDCIDATPYIDENGDPWTVYVDGWNTAKDGIGTMYAWRLSPDLSKTVGDPVYLFKATDPVWTNHQVTDAPWLYTAKDGSLIMLWSNSSYSYGYSGYAVAVAVSESGSIVGPWKHMTSPLLFRNSSLGNIKHLFDGGHAAIFTDSDGKLKMVYHISNSGNPKMFISEIEEKDNMLVFSYDY